MVRAKEKQTTIESSIPKGEDGFVFPGRTSMVPQEYLGEKICFDRAVPGYFGALSSMKSLSVSLKFSRLFFRCAHVVCLGYTKCVIRTYMPEIETTPSPFFCPSIHEKVIGFLSENLLRRQSQYPLQMRKTQF